MDSMISHNAAPAPYTPRESDIIHAVHVNRLLSRTGIAQALQMKKHPQLIDIIEGLVKRGALIRQEGSTKKNVACYVYSIGRIE